MCDRIPAEQIAPAAKVFVRCCWRGKNGLAAKHAACDLLADSPVDPDTRDADGHDPEWQRLADAIVEAARCREVEIGTSKIGEPPETVPRWLADREIELRNALNVTKPVLDSEDLIRAVAADYDTHADQRDERAMADWCRNRAAQLRTCIANVRAKENAEARGV